MKEYGNVTENTPKNTFHSNQKLSKAQVLIKEKPTDVQF